MKRLLKLSGFVVLVTALNVVTVLAIMSMSAGAGSGPGPLAGPFPPGDVNCDRGFDIADAVFLLNALFVPGSPVPVA